MFFLAEYIILRAHCNIDNIVYAMGETINIDDGALATRLLNEANITAVVKTLLPDDADALFAEKETQIKELEKALDVANRSNKLLTKQLMDQEAKITTLTAKK